jgi:hypothetical protein
MNEVVILVNILPYYGMVEILFSFPLFHMHFITECVFQVTGQPAHLC